MKYFTLSYKINLLNTLWSDDFYLTNYSVSFQFLIWKTFIAKFVRLYIRLCLCNPLIFLTSFTLYLCIIIIIFNYSHFLILFLFLIFFLFIKALIAKLLQWIVSMVSCLIYLFATIIGDCKFCAIQNPIFKIKMHFAVVFCLFTYDYFTEINSNHSQADFFWLTKSCKSFYYRLQENNNRSKCFDFECIKRVE